MVVSQSKAGQCLHLSTTIVLGHYYPFHSAFSTTVKFVLRSSLFSSRRPLLSNSPLFLLLFFFEHKEVGTEVPSQREIHLGNSFLVYIVNWL